MGRIHALPDFPWDRLAPMSARARAHPQGMVDLTIGTPVDPSPAVAMAALAAAADAPGYPPTIGSPAVRDAARRWLSRRAGVAAELQVGISPSIGSKEVVTGLATWLGFGTGDRVMIPRVAYPSYDVGAVMAGCEVVVSDDPADVAGAALVWINSPGNPTGRIADVDELAAFVSAARESGAIIASDECYAEFAWDKPFVSVLDDRVCGGDATGILALHSLSKRSNMAGYRFGFIAGDHERVAEVLEVRKHLGLMVAAPVQAAAVAALDDDEHVDIQRHVYERRRADMHAALLSAGFRIDHSEGGLYLWATRDEPCWHTAELLAEHGILVTPGDFYGSDGDRHVRVALTATDEVIAMAVARLLHLRT